ncbi:arsenate reductase (glutaredoxin) [Tropicimonas sediminicola]|uniref:Arsenate reductase n=1 Tax=Tropicimonas sediminicola TaxID=1031541 RepID=A0A239KFE2_9RHOB|nr:arsenate reductase (glutaredoxin) [Tropicimonas sediminicola]SNT16349.1 arsenate reductase [Tropicimonas sediminicola]
MDVTIYHNPACSKSREVLRVIEASGYTPEVVEYVETGWERGQLEALLRDAGLTPRQALRKQRGPAADMGLLEDGVTDAEIFEAMLERPVLVERPIVRTELGTRLCRPVGVVLDLLERWPDAPFAKANGRMLIDAQGLPVPGE